MADSVTISLKQYDKLKEELIKYRNMFVLDKDHQGNYKLGISEKNAYEIFEKLLIDNKLNHEYKMIQRTYYPNAICTINGFNMYAELKNEGDK